MVLLLSMAVFLTTFSCSKQQIDTTKSIIPSSTNITPPSVNELFNARVGAPISLATGKQWIENFNLSNRNVGKDYIIPSHDLKTILTNTSCVGICLYYAIDENNNAHILPIGIDNNGRIIKTANINTQNGTINWETAKKWIANDLGEIDARFFGRNTFNRLFKDQKCTNIRAISALNEENKPQLLLIDAAINYKILSGLNTLLKFEDRSNPCPPYCGIYD